MKNDDQLYEDINDKLAFEPYIDADKIAIAVHKGIVTLGGVVPQFNQREAAEKAVKNVNGVKGVANEIKVEAAPFYQRDDVDIANAVVNAFAWNVNIPSENIKIVVKDGCITLSGEVNWFYQKQAAEFAAHNLYGVKGIINEITIKPTILANDVKNKIIKEFKRNAAIDAENISVKIEGSTVNLKGSVRNWLEMQQASHAAWAIPGVTKVENQLMIK